MSVERIHNFGAGPGALPVAVLEEAQRDPVYSDLGLPYLKVGARVPSDVLEHLVALYAELRRQRTRPTATPG